MQSAFFFGFFPPPSSGPGVFARFDSTCTWRTSDADKTFIVEWIVRNIEFFTLPFYNFTQCRVMNMTDAGKKMVLYLVIQPAGKPGDQFIIGRKIGGGL